MTRSMMKSKFCDLLRKKNGNFAMIAALTLPVMFMAGSLAVDTTNVLSMKTRLQNAVDSAALATATRLLQEENLTPVQAKAFAEKFLDGQIEEDMSVFAGMSVKPTVTVLPVTVNNGIVWKVSISMVGTQTLTPMARMLGKTEQAVNVVGKAESGQAGSQGSFSMALVLDQSGSMGWTLGGVQKISVLKSAVRGLVDQIKAADPKRKYTRIGGASYASSLKGKQKLNWNPNKLMGFVNGVTADGGTDSTDAFNWAFQSVTALSEDQLHEQMSGQTPTKFIVFMTDGDNNYTSADTSTMKLCDAAKQKGVEIYSVAFAAPTRGKALLSYCASSSDKFFDAQNSSDLISAFENIGQQTAEVVSRLTQ